MNPYPLSTPHSAPDIRYVLWAAMDIIARQNAILHAHRMELTIDEGSIFLSSGMVQGRLEATLAEYDAPAEETPMQHNYPELLTNRNGQTIIDLGNGWACFYWSWEDFARNYGKQHVEVEKDDPCGAPATFRPARELMGIEDQDYG